MHRAKQLWKWMGSSAAKTWRRARPWINFASLMKKAKSQGAHELISPAGILVGAVAFGLWWQNLGAAIFGAIGLFFLAGIYRTTESMLAAMRRPENGLPFGSEDARWRMDAMAENSDDVEEAIGTLKPWLVDEVALTEEDAKQSCAVLVDSVVQRARAIQSAANFVRDADPQKNPAFKRVGEFQLAPAGGGNEEVHH
jgi:hypothetical protein